MKFEGKRYALFFVLLCAGMMSMAGAQGQEREPLKLSVHQYGEQKGAVIAWESVDGAVSYEVQRGDGQNREFTKIASGDAVSCQYNDFNIQRGKYYFYRVMALMENGVCHYSEEAVFGCPIQSVFGVRFVRCSNSSVKLYWNKTKKARYYKVYCAKSKRGKYRYVGVTKKNKYYVKKLKPGKTYYYKIRACVKKKESMLDSKDSALVRMKTRPRHYTTVFAGDSIMTGMKSYHTMEKVKIGGRKELVAAIGLNTITFRTRRTFGGQSGLQRVISYKPYRVYMLLGINEIHYRSSKDVIAQYKDMIKTIRTQSPATDIVLLPLAPVTEAEQQNRTGFGQIPKYNNGLKKLARRMGLKYYDYTGFLKNSRGFLSERYAVADGVHWNAAAYDLFAKKIEKFDRTLE